jgi:hypothetical protein
MLPIYTQPRTSATHTTLQATCQTWRDLVRTLEVNNQTAYVGIIHPFLRDVSDDAVVRITFLNNVATKILHMIGLTS